MTDPLMPSEVDEHVGWFDRLSERADRIIASPAWFSLSALGVLLWVIGLPFAGILNDTYHLLLNSPTTALTFLIVSTGACTTARAFKALQHKLNAIADALADLMEGEHPDDAAELRSAVGLERRESSG
jgi:low affinity Fe/Cu permease